MDPMTFLNFGERVDVEIEGKSYKADIQDIGPEDIICISQPMIKQTPIFIPPHTEMKIVYYRPNGMYEFPASMVGTAENEALRMIRLKILTEPHKYQRRMNFRVAIRIPVSAIVIGELPAATGKAQQSFYTQTIDISEGGMGVYAPHSYPLGTRMRVEFTIALDEQEESLSLLADLARCTWPQKDGDQFHLGVCFTDISDKTKRLLSKYIIQEQIRMRKRAAYELKNM